MEESATVDDGSPDDATGTESEFVEVDPTGRYGRYNEVLGKGAYKTVYKAFDDLDGIEVAWNQVKFHDVLHSSGDLDRLYSELHLLKTLKHKNIIKFYNSWVDTRSKNVNFITEIFTSGTLRQYRKKHRHVNLRAIKHWSRQILRGLVYLHSHDPPIIHRDLKCDNIFINGNNGEVKIGDLGLATILRRAPSAQSVIGTPEFMAPELYEEHYNELVDIYSFGMCLLEMLTSEYPYSECINAAQIYRKVTMGKKPAALSKVNDPETRQFVEKCLASASERLHARELLMDPFLRNNEDLETSQPSCKTILNPYGGLRALDPIPEDSNLRSIPSAEKIDHFSKSNIQSSPRKEERLGLDNVKSLEKPQVFDSSSPKEGLKRSKDFRIKGRKQDEKKVLIRIRIASAEGEIRIIQFDFDVEADTAISVANEMVAELDLSDQDISTIADMIDTEMLALIPDWKQGSALDEAADEVVNEQNGPSEHNSQSQEVKEDDELPVVHTSDLLIVPSDDSQSTFGPGFTYGRFEEVDCNAIGSDVQQQEADSLCFFSDFSSESSGSISSVHDSLSVETGVDDSMVQSLQCSETDAKSDSLPSSVGKLPKNLEVEKKVDKEEHIVSLGSDHRLDDSEVGRLIMQQKEELQTLRSKHELAIRELKTRLAQHTLTSEGKILSRDILTNEHVQSSKSLERPLEVIRSSKLAISIGQAAVSGIVNGTSVLTGPLIEGTLAESRHAEGELHAENTSTISMSVSDIAIGSHDMVARNDAKANVIEELESKSKTGLNEVASSEDFIKKAPITTGADVNGAVAEVVGTPLTVSKPNVCPDKGFHACPISRPTVELNGPESRCISAGHDDAKPALASLARRESYLELYKSSNNKDIVSKSKSSEQLAVVDAVLKTTDANQEHLKKQQVQKSIADLEAKTLQNLSLSNNKYLVGTAVKSHAGVAVQNGQQGATAKTHAGATSQQGPSIKSLSGCTVQNCQQGATTKNLPGGAIQNGHQGAGVKNIPSPTLQNGQQSATAKVLPAAMTQMSQMKSHTGATSQNSQSSATVNGLSGVTQNGQQSASVKNVTGAPVQLDSALKNHPCAALQNGQQCAAAKNFAGASQSGPTAAQARQQHM